MRTWGWLVAILLLTNCSGESGLEQLRQAMYDQPRYEPLEASAFFADGLSSRAPVKGTVARGQLNADVHLHTGIGSDGQPVETFPFEVTRDVLARGQERYDIFCSPCHDHAGTGRGMVVQRGFKQPTSFHVDRLRTAPPGYYFDVMTQGFGSMYSYASKLGPEDRWAVAAYIRALQLSQNAGLEDVPEAERPVLEQAQ